MQAMSHQYHCLAPDLPGFGESSLSSAPISIALMTECLAEYLQALRSPVVYLVGHSLGGWVAANYALRYPEGVKGLILIEPEGIESRRLAKRWRWYRLLSGPFSILLKGLSLLTPFAAYLGLKDFFHRLYPVRQRLKTFPTACRLLFQRRPAEIRAEQLQEQLPQLQPPLLLLESSQTSDLTQPLNEDYQHLVPHAQVVVIGDCQSPLESPQQAAQLIGQFIQSANATE